MDFYFVPDTTETSRRTGSTYGSSQLFFIFAMFSLLAAAECIFMHWVALPRDAHEIAGKTAIKNSLFVITGLETTNISGDRKIRFKIGSTMVTPRKYVVFSIKPLNEAIFEDFSVDYFRQPQDRSMFHLNDIQEAILPADRKGMFSGLFNLNTGVITRGIISRFVLTIYEGDEIKTVVKSAKAELDFKNNKIRLEDASIEQQALKRITKSSEAVLKNYDGTVYIHGKYSILHPEGVLKGSGVKIKL
jgi:hypothetical protein